MPLYRGWVIKVVLVQEEPKEVWEATAYDPLTGDPVAGPVEGSSAVAALASIKGEIDTELGDAPEPEPEPDDDDNDGGGAPPTPGM